MSSVIVRTPLAKLDPVTVIPANVTVSPTYKDNFGFRKITKTFEEILTEGITARQTAETGVTQTLTGNSLPSIPTLNSGVCTRQYD